MVKWYDNTSVGQFRGANEINKLIFPFEPLFPLTGHRDFYCQIYANDHVLYFKGSFHCENVGARDPQQFS